MSIKHLNEILPQHSGDFKSWFLSRADRDHPLSIQYVEVEGVVTPHSHPVEETIFYIEGRGIARIGEREIRIKPGTLLVIPPGTVHSSIREGLEPLRYLDISVGNPDL